MKLCGGNDGIMSYSIRHLIRNNFAQGEKNLLQSASTDSFVLRNMHVRVLSKAERYRKFRRNSAHRKEIIARAKLAFEDRRAEQLLRIEEKERQRVQRIRFAKERPLVCAAQKVVPFSHT